MKPPAPRLGYEATARAIYVFLVAHGATPAGACAMLGNIQAESSFEPWQIEAVYHNGYGLCQWSFSRRAAFLAQAQKEDIDWRDLNFQLGYMLHELQHGYPHAWAIMSTTRDAYQAAIDVERIYEGSPDSPAYIIEHRAKPAREWFAKLAPHNGVPAWPGKPFGLGAHGSPVVALQAARKLTRTGTFDATLKASVVAWQKQHPWVKRTDGVVDENTYRGITGV